MAVVLWHGSRYLAPYGAGRSALFQPGATFGVSLFFMISGYIMVHTTRNNTDVWTFVVKRVTRIWPVWLIALALYMLLPARHTDDLKWLLGSIALLPVSSPQPVFAPIYDFPVLSVGWTLKYEVYFYAFFAVSMLFGRRLRWWAFAAWIVLSLVVIPGGDLLSLARWSPLTDLGFRERTLQIVTNPIVWLFAIGSAIAHFQPRLILNSRKPFIAAAALMAVLIALQWGTHFRTENGVFEWGLTLVPLMLLFAMADGYRWLAVPAWLVWLGDISFSLYLFHPLAQEGFDAVTRGEPIGGYPSLFVTTMLSLVFAWISYSLIERKLCVRLQRGLTRAPQQQLQSEAAPGRGTAR